MTKVTAKAIDLFYTQYKSAVDIFDLMFPTIQLFHEIIS
jgi:hypothetical protein